MSNCNIFEHAVRKDNNCTLKITHNGFAKSTFHLHECKIRSQLLSEIYCRFHAFKISIHLLIFPIKCLKRFDEKEKKVIANLHDIGVYTPTHTFVHTMHRNLRTYKHSPRGLIKRRTEKYRHAAPAGLRKDTQETIYIHPLLYVHTLIEHGSSLLCSYFILLGNYSLRLPPTYD